MPSELKGLVLKGFTQSQFQTYVAKEVAPKMSAWRPRGMCIHNTGHKTSQWPGVWPKGSKLAGKPITPLQRLRNMSVDWQARLKTACPHLVVSPDGMIWACWPLWKHGVHSPSFNLTYWGLELFGDFRSEKLNDVQRDTAAFATACLLGMLGRTANVESIRFHKEDPRTGHRDCPGKHVGTKATWIAAVGAEMASLSPNDH